MSAIPMISFEHELALLKPHIIESLSAILDSGQFIGGPWLAQLEQAMAQYCQVQHAIMLNSGTDALVIAMRALGIGAGHEVIVPSFTFFATAETVSSIGATPIFADIDPHTFNMVEHLEGLITPRTKAIMPVHLFGYPAPLQALQALCSKHNLHLIEDCAQSLGSLYQGKPTGTFGDFGAFSFYPTKNLGAYGDGGMLITNNDELAATARKLANHGSSVRYHNDLIGYNSRLDAFQAAVLLAKLPHLPQWIAARYTVAQRYNQAFAGQPALATPALHPQQAVHQYTLRIKNGQRQSVQQALQSQNIASMVYYPIACHQQKPYQHLGVQLPHTEQATLEVLSLPIWPHMSATQQDTVINAVLQSLNA